jgi:hypothetical protein
MIADSTRNKTPQKPLGLHYNKIPIAAPCNDSAFTAKKPENRNFQSPVGKVGLVVFRKAAKTSRRRRAGEGSCEGKSRHHIAEAAKKGGTSQTRRRERIPGVYASNGASTTASLICPALNAVG